MATPETASDLILVFGHDSDTEPLARFGSRTVASQILDSLGLKRGGLKTKGASDFERPHDAVLFAGSYTVINAVMRVRVSMYNVSLVLVVKNSTARVSALYDLIATKFQGLVPAEEVRVAELRSGGYLLSTSDVIHDVLHDGDSVEALDFETWVREQLKNCNREWHRLWTKEYAANEPERWISIGSTKNNRIYVRLGYGYSQSETTLRFETYDRAALQRFGTDGLHVLAEATGQNRAKEQWWLKVLAEVHSGAVKGLQIERKIGFHSAARINYLPLDLSVGIDPGQLVQRQTMVPRDRKQRIPPPAQHQGPSLDQLIAAEKAVGPLLVPTGNANKSDGNLLIHFSLNRSVDAQQSASETDWTQYYIMEFVGTNLTRDDVPTARVQAEYEKTPGQWVPFSLVQTGRKNPPNSREYYTWDEKSQKLLFRANDTAEFLVRVGIEHMDVPHWWNQRRSHSSLPQPMRIRVALIDLQERKSSLVVEQLNESISKDLYTKERAEKAGMQWYFMVDDTNYYKRYVVGARREEPEGDNEEVRYWIGMTNATGSYLHDSQSWKMFSDIDPLVYKAVSQNCSELPLDRYKSKYEELGISLNGYLLVDLELRRAYGVKFAVKTSTGAHTESFYWSPDWV